MNREELEKQRLIVLDRLSKAGVVKSKKIKNAFLKVPREEFLPKKLRARAYEDTPLPIGWGQTISAIHMVLIMLEELKLSKGLTVLEVGTGSGYHAALCAELIKTNSKGCVYTIERVKPLAVFALKNVVKTGYRKWIRVFHRDGSKGLPEKAPFDRILVTAASPSIPPPLIEQLNDPGVMVIPVGGLHLWQDLIVLEKENGKVTQINKGGVAFVPLIGEYGFKYDNEVIDN
ncbi:MAG: protein-L-isoaspartate(D-aspartate) O-methyltransferase [Candidatus Odinarchaeum yellowstonii]|uniref:Protein-L-isoaspartate O-methyltransferase n=1 Tax=Odinarchaeota yellowstonii (strain LCB_4) TaxID=1841599 RepID=A0AAF0IBW4_ODILC|nr:MAG: protein-L-isoaspartate(D-aspartate) O-methyltransferase [Candidatus Odinarchaeum yellowstonii]